MSSPTCSISEVETKPYRDPNSTKYPDRTFFAGQWRTPEQVERNRKRKRERKRERRANDPEWVERERKRKRERKREKYANDPEWRDRFLKLKRERKREKYRNDTVFWLKERAKYAEYLRRKSNANLREG